VTGRVAAGKVGMSRRARSVRDLDEDFVGAYFRHRPDVASWWQPEAGRFRNHYERELAAVTSLLEGAQQGIALDYGTGRGRIARLLADRGYRVLALDVNPFIIREAKALASNRSILYCVADSAVLSGQSRFAVVTLVEVLDHVPAPADLIADLVASMSPGGLFVCTFVSRESLYGRLADIARRWTVDPSLKVARTYYLSSVVALLSDLGLQVERTVGVGLFSVPLRPGLGILGWPLSLIASAEGLLSPCVHAASIVHRCTTVVLRARKPT
jgi:2-polyprenyl-6-hydroxyphenyl methylase/3-demethylubiquinone-9 3-methyltransferase